MAATGKNLILVVPNQKYGESIISVIKKIVDKYNKLCYITLNERTEHLIESFEQNQIDAKKFFFIDAVSKKSKSKEKERDNCIYVSAPNALIELSLAVSRVIEKENPDLFILDSASTLLIYEEHNTSIRFMHSLMEKTDSCRSDFFITILYSDEKNPAIEELGLFVDEFVDISRFTAG
jgi:KaiC/GvpD/RAD55 family RecA-like ATPase